MSFDLRSGKQLGSSRPRKLRHAVAAIEPRGADLHALDDRPILEMIARGAPLDTILDELTAFVEEEEPGSRCGVLIVTEDGAHFRRGGGRSLPEIYHQTLDSVPITPPYFGACGETAHACVAVTVADIATDSRYADRWRDLVLSCGLRAVRSTPICGTDDRVLGSLAVYYEQPRDPHPANPRLIETATHLASIALERKFADKRQRQTEAELARDLAATQRLQQISTQLIREDNVEALYAQILDAAVMIMGSEYASIQMLYPERGEAGELRLLGHRGFSEEAVRFWEWVSPTSASACGSVLRTGERCFVPDVEACDFMAGSDDLAASRQTGIRAVQTTPLMSRSGHMVGMISTHWKQPRQPRAQSLRLLDVLARQAADLIERSQADKTLRERETNLRLAVDIGRLGHWEYDLATKGLTVSAPGRANFGYGPDETFAEDEVSAGIHPDDRDSRSRALKHAIVTKSDFDLECRVITREGEPKWLEMRGCYQETPDGRGRLIGVSQDITERKTNELTLSRRNRGLKLLTEIGGDLLLQGEAQALLRRGFDAVAAEIGAEVYFNYLVKEDDPNRLSLSASGGLDAAGEAEFADISIGQYLCGRVARERRPLILSALRDLAVLDHDLVDKSSGVRELGLQCYAGFPLLAQGQLLGTIAFGSTTKEAFAPQDIELLTTISSQFASAILREHLTAGLRESEARFRAMADSAPAPVWVTNAQGKIEFVNQAFEEVAGRPRQQLMGDAWIALLHPDDLAGVAARRAQAWIDYSPYAIDARFRRADGEWRWMHISSKPRLDGSGKFQGYVGMAVDLTDVRRVEADLRESEEFKDRIIESSQDCIKVLDLNGRLLWMSRGGQEALEVGDIEPLIGTGWVDFFRSEDRSPAEIAVKAAANGDVSRFSGLAPTLTGKDKFWESIVAPMLHADGVPGRLLVVSRDMTEQRRAEERRNVLINELNHRVKNTLATVQSLAMQTLRSTERSADARELFDSRLAALSRAHDVLTDESWEGADLREVVNRAIAPFQTGERRLTIEGPAVRLSPKQALALSMALHELATNASKYGALSADAGHVRVAWKTSTDDNTIKLDLTWTEQGGPPVARPKRKGFGTRLIEQNLANDLDGEVSVEYRSSGVVAGISSPLHPRQHTSGQRHERNDEEGSTA